jgi:hypothetical protein
MNAGRRLHACLEYLMFGGVELPLREGGVLRTAKLFPDRKSGFVLREL